ncbi:MAG TPA: HAMP domain-containing sensor histidine kinase [Solirubrobacteraceae bacterium]
MSGRPPARTRLIVASVLAVVAALAVFVVIVTVDYRDGLEQRVRADLTSGASALAQVRTPASFKSTLASLAGEGISAEVARNPGKVGRPPAPRAVTSSGGLLTVVQAIHVNGRELIVTLRGSLAGVDRQVRSLELTEAIGGAIALALLAALARALVLLDRAVADARASEAAMRTFLADASHELRNPVAALHATAERLLRDQPERPARDAIEAQLARDSGRLGQLVDDLLNLARLDAREPAQYDPVDLTELVSVAVTAARGAEPAGRLELITDGPVPATGDRDALLRAIGNLLDNALAVAGTATVEAAGAPRGPAVIVSDDGPGVPAHQRERIFEPFYRLPRSPRGGTGLGLAIVRRTTEAHGGTVSCDPSPMGGARFTLRLPPAVTPDRARPDRR